MVSRLKECNINWVTDAKIAAPTAVISFTKGKDKMQVSYYVLDAQGRYMVKEQRFGYKNAETAAVQLAYRLFNISDEEPQAKEQKVNTQPS